MKPRSRSSVPTSTDVAGSLKPTQRHFSHLPQAQGADQGFLVPSEETHPPSLQPLLDAGWKLNHDEMGNAYVNAPDQTVRLGYLPGDDGDALWKVRLKGVNGDIAFIKEGPAGKESGQAEPNIYVVELKDGAVAVK